MGGSSVGYKDILFFYMASYLHATSQILLKKKTFFKSHPRSLAMVPFGWSAGDIKDAVQFLIRLCTTFQDAGCSNSDFQEAIDFLCGLQIVLEHLRTYTMENPGHLYSKDIEDLVQQIDRPWKKFRDFLKPYEDSLGINSVRSSIARAPRVVLWALVTKEVRQLKTSVGQLVQSLTLLLLLQLL